MIKYGYFRHRFDAHTNTKLNKFVDDVGLVGFAYYYLLLELYGAYIAKADDKSAAHIHQRVIANTWRKRVDSCHKVMTKLQLSDLLVFTLCDSTYSIEVPKYLDYFGSYGKTEAINSRNKIKENKIKENKSVYIENKQNILGKKYSDLVSDISSYYEQVVASGITFTQKANYCIASIMHKFPDTELEDFKSVIEHKYSEWKNDPEFRSNLDPCILFKTQDRFMDYLNQAKIKNNRAKFRNILLED